MKGMKGKDIREMNDDNLFEKAAQLREGLFRQRFKLSLGNTEVVNQIRADRKNLARVKTELRAREVKQEIEAGTRPARNLKTRAGRTKKTARAHNAGRRA